MTTHVFKPDMPPPGNRIGVVAWARANLFSSWLNTLLTLFALYLIWLIVPPLLSWTLFDANWVGTTRADCTKSGACWVFIEQRFSQFMYGYYPSALRWRVDLTVCLAIFGAAPLFVSRFKHKAVYGLSFLVIYPILAYSLLHGGHWGLTAVAPMPARCPMAVPRRCPRWRSPASASGRPIGWWRRRSGPNARRAASCRRGSGRSPKSSAVASAPRPNWTSPRPT